MNDLLAGVVLAGITTLLGFYFGKRKIEHEYNKELNIVTWKERSNQYKKLLKIMGVLPKWPNRKGQIKRFDMLATAEKLREWYFDGGGLFLSYKSRDCYFMIQKIINENLLKNDLINEEKLNIFLSDDEYDDIRELMSNLRTELTNDLESRERDRFDVQNKK